MHTESKMLRQYCPGAIFIETGTCYGRTVEFVLIHGAKSVRSVEGHEGRYKHCAELFANDDRVRLWHGHSKDCLKEMIEDLSEPAVFFLDAHPSGADSYGHDEVTTGEGEGFGQHEVLLAELKIIAAHPIKDHTILVDDQHTTIAGVAEQQIYKDFLLTINPAYQFKFMHKKGPLCEKTAGCLIAEIKR